MRTDIDKGGIRELERDPAVVAKMYGFARRAANQARLIAPVGTVGKNAGEYRRRIFARRGLSGTTASAVYGSHSYKAWWVEFGTVNHKAHRTLRKAAKAVGMRVAKVAKPGGGGG